MAQQVSSLAPSRLLKSLRGDRHICPKCRSEDVEVEDPVTSDGDQKIFVVGGCGTCKYEWTEIYSLSSAREGKIDVDHHAE